MFRKTWPVAIISPLVVLGAPASAVENQSQTIECVGVLRSYPVHVSDIDNPRLKAGHGGLVADTGGKQSKDCDQSFDSENWKKVRDACHEDKLCRVVGVIGPSGWKCVIKAEDYSEAGQKVKEARTAPSLEPFLFFSDLEGSYQGSGWLKHDLLVGCHKVEGEGGEMITQCSISDNASVQEDPHGSLIAGLSKGTDVLVFEREGEWAKIETDCSGSIMPGSWEGHDDVFRFSCPEKAQ